ncbi:MAG: membrane protein insertase YidC [Chlorobi bacterium]|nr:MAG: membrane protein insertase YidC [Bacteroidota bacterium]KXK33898.1 MAG: preprotein translocase subunit YidC [Chlorobi bacterium OLB6]MBE2265049.1 membrane protein insertase YidC [Flavobacteriales bacterium]MBL1161506.1 membrane protein insertase YidC [Chlorobiota bacterium]MBW7854084.1 membrane protein insertase YidC [Candidatus Kapabacteria bacterium]MCC6330539.1 membrane protein insertase YidC [Ignavibacteria bacterium]
MDRTSLIGIILIGVVVASWIFIQSTFSSRDITPQQTAAKKEKADSSRTAVTSVLAQADTPAKAPLPEERITIETDLLRVVLSSQGGTIRSWKLKGYKPWYHALKPHDMVDLVHPGAHEFGFSFRQTNGSKLNAYDIPFTWGTGQRTIVVKGADSVVIRGTATLPSGGSIERDYVFYGNRYGVQTRLVLDNLEATIPQTNRFVNLEWAQGIRYQEHNSVDESNSAVAIAAYGDEIDELDATDYNTPEERSASGHIRYLATRTKYFSVALMPSAGFDGSVFYAGTRYGAKNEGHVEKYSLTYKLPYSGGRQVHNVLLYAGPMQYDTLQNYGLTGIMNFGFKWIVKPIGEYFMLPTMKFIHGFIPNWGIAIIVFGLLLKVVLYPLSIKQLQSAQKMQLVAPLMNEIREKYKDDMQRQQQETMKLYGEYGINPAGGCFPLLLQMPILYAMYAVLNMNIELRQAAFLPFWITDLSVPDVILSIPFKLPIVNIDKFSGLAIAMGATLLIQQKQVVTDPRQKALVYMMPVMLTLMFSTLPAGLNLYYFVFNIVGIIQQWYMKHHSKNKLTLADLKAMPKKESWMQRKMREAQEMAAAQGRTLPGQQGGSGKARQSGQQASGTSRKKGGKR